MYRHNDQLEELRNLQDRLQEDKTAWLKRKEHEEKELEEQRKKQQILQEQIKLEQQDIQEQREQLYRKMEMLSNQGLLISPNVAIPVNQQPSNVSSEIDGQSNCAVDEHHPDGNSSERRKDRWKPAPGKLRVHISRFSLPLTSDHHFYPAIKPSPVNLASATNSPKISSIKQQLPLKLSSLSK